MQFLIDVFWKILPWLWERGQTTIGQLWHQLWDAIRLMGEAETKLMFAALKPMFPTVTWSAYQSQLNNINSFFPLQETVAFASIFFTMWSLILLYRLIKSWIPAVAS